MKYHLTIWAGIMISGILFSCEDKVHPQLENAAPTLVVDAWLNNKPGQQIIVLTQTQPYFYNSLPSGISSALVSVTDDKGMTYLFPEDGQQAGHYVWKPLANEVFGIVGNRYTLKIQTGGETFESLSYMGRVPTIDSITFDTEKRIGAKDSITRAEFWATDPAGSGDAYWIRSYKNGVLLNRPGEMNVAYDAGFSAGGETDGVTFITPIRRGINSNDQDANGRNLSPIQSGDSMNVQINSITRAAFNYLNEVRTQTDRPGGFQELFATPLANVSTNISSTRKNGTKVLGFFNIAAVSIAGKRYKK